MCTASDSLTHVPVLVLPSHLHFDHVGRIEEFPRVALVSTPALRPQVVNGTLSESPEQYLLPTKHEFRVSRWLNSGEILDLGGRRITVLATPGHTPDSVSLVDSDHHRVFTGDLPTGKALWQPRQDRILASWPCPWQRW